MSDADFAKGKKYVETIIASAIDTGDFEAFVKKLQHNYIKVSATVTSSGQVTGLSFSYQGQKFTCTALGHPWKALSPMLRYSSEGHKAIAMQIAEASGGGSISNSSSSVKVVDDSDDMVWIAAIVGGLVLTAGAIWIWYWYF